MLISITGCGTTKFSDTARTATEQILISSAMEDAVDEFNFYPLSGRKVFMKTDGVSSTDKEYLLSILRQQLAANGVLLQETKEEADYILEVATGAVGTDRYELIYGTKETSVPSMLTMGVSTSIPEFALAKRTDQMAKVKLSMWAYNQKTGAIVWQSGQKNSNASVRDRWILGVGPITKSSFNENTQIAGSNVPFDVKLGERIAKDEKPSVRTEATYRELDQEAIDRLESIRKAGFEMMTGSSDEESGETQAEEGAEESKDETPAEESAKEPEPEAKEEAPAEKAETPAPETAPVPSPVSIRPLPALEFDDDFSLSVGETTVVP